MKCFRIVIIRNYNANFWIIWVYHYFLLCITISANNPKKNVCMARATTATKVVSKNLSVAPSRKAVGMVKAPRNINKLKGPNTFSGLKKRESLVTNFKKLKKCLALREDSPCLL